MKMRASTVQRRELRTGTQATTDDILGALSGSSNTADTETTMAPSTGATTTNTPSTDDSMDLSATMPPATITSTTEPKTIGPLRPTAATHRAVQDEATKATTAPNSLVRRPETTTGSAIGASTNTASGSNTKTLVSIAFIVGAIVVIALTILFVHKRRKLRNAKKFASNSTLFSPHFSPSQTNCNPEEGNFTISAPSLFSVQESQTRVSGLSQAESTSTFQFNSSESNSLSFQFKPSFATSPSASTTSSIQFNLGPSSFVMMDTPNSSQPTSSATTTNKNSQPSPPPKSSLPNMSNASSDFSFSTGFSFCDSRGTALELSSVLSDDNDGPTIKILDTPKGSTATSPIPVATAAPPSSDPAPPAPATAEAKTPKQKLVDAHQFSSRDLLDMTTAAKQHAPKRFSVNSLHDSEYGDFHTLPKTAEQPKQFALGHIADSHGACTSVSRVEQDMGSESVISFHSDASSSSSDLSDELHDMSTSSPSKNSEVHDDNNNNNNNEEEEDDEIWI